MVTTTDGYKLRLYRIRLTDNAKKLLIDYDNQKKNFNKVILLQHGMLDSSDGWFLNDEEGSLGFHLVNQGYDVWAGNNRGNKYSRGHVKEPNLSEHNFMNFSFTEMALYDIPSFYKFILAKTSAVKINYIGHSQGTTQLFAALLDPTTKKFITEKTEKFIALAPVVYLSYGKSWIIDLLNTIKKTVVNIVHYIGIYDQAPSTCTGRSTFSKVLKFVCTWMAPFICDRIMPGIMVNRKYDTLFDRFEFVTKHYPSGLGVHLLLHLSQFWDMNKNPRFQKYDHGEKQNMKVYGSKKPPIWNLEDLNVDLTQISGDMDQFATPENVKLQMNKIKKPFKIFWLKNFDHLTFLLPRKHDKYFQAIDYVLSDKSKNPNTHEVHYISH